MKLNLLTLFPHFFDTPLNSSMLAKAQERAELTIKLVDIRQFAQDKHQVTDEPPYGGGAGMVLKIEPIDQALQSLGCKKGGVNKKIILTSAKGKLFTQQTAQAYSQLEEITIICGHYQGVDERVAQHLVDEEVRVGDFVLTGGEPAALVMIDSVVRLLPGVLGNEASLENESHQQEGVAGCPHYTRPAEYKGWPVPRVLLSGDHQAIESWRQEEMKKID